MYHGKFICTFVVLMHYTREEDLFNAVLRYADTKGQTREETLSIITQLLPHIRFTLCSPKFLGEHALIWSSNTIFS